MRELLFKNMTSWDHNKRDIFVQETIEKDGILAKTTRRCLYFVKERVRVKNNMDFTNITSLKLDDDESKRHFHVLKERDSDHGIDRLMCKVAGSFYAVANNYLYRIIFIHTFKISFSPLKHR